MTGALLVVSNQMLNDPIHFTLEILHQNRTINTNGDGLAQTIRENTRNSNNKKPLKIMQSGVNKQPSEMDFMKKKKKGRRKKTK